MDRERLIAELRDIACQEREYLADVTGEEAGYIAEVLYVAADMLEQEPKDAHWVCEPDRRQHWHCSECGYVTGPAGLMGNYCPECGAKVQKKSHSQLMVELSRGVTDYETD